MASLFFQLKALCSSYRLYCIYSLYCPAPADIQVAHVSWHFVFWPNLVEHRSCTCKASINWERFTRGTWRQHFFRLVRSTFKPAFSIKQQFTVIEENPRVILFQKLCRDTLNLSTEGFPSNPLPTIPDYWNTLVLVWVAPYLRVCLKCIYKTAYCQTD